MQLSKTTKYMLAMAGGLFVGAGSARGADVPFIEHVISITADGAMSVFATDLDGDGDIDVLSASLHDDKIAWYESDGGSPPSFTERVISTAADHAASVFATDVDGDGDTDVLSASRDDDKIAWYESDGGSPPSFTERIVSTAANGAFSVFATDLDGDGDTDILSASWNDDKVAWYESDGGSPPTFTERVISTAALGAFSVFATDLDGDGDTDVLSASLFDDKIAWYENDGGLPPSFTERVISTTADAGFSVFATDMDGDGDTDVLSASRNDDKIAWYENDGGSPPTFTERVISTAADGAFSVFATDLDGDGDTDVLSASRFDDKIAWYESDGGSPPAFTERVISTTANGGFSVFATDLDGDGATDILSASLRDDKIAWYENTTPRCGDGLVEGAEACDDGYTDDCGTCNADCTAAGTGSVCGDGELCPEFEMCDPPGSDCCDASCHFEPAGTTCTDDGDACTDDTCVDGACVHTLQPGCVVAHLDIKPGSCPNPVNPRSMGVVPIAILGSESLDVTQIDVDSLTLARADGVGGIVTVLTDRHGPRPRINDVAAQVEGQPCDCHQPGGDGIDDLLLKISTPEFAAALELGSLARGASVMLTLSGSLFDGTAFEASDCIVIPGRNVMQRKRGKR